MLKSISPFFSNIQNRCSLNYLDSQLSFPLIRTSAVNFAVFTRERAGSPPQVCPLQKISRLRGIWYSNKVKKKKKIF